MSSNPVLPDWLQVLADAANMHGSPAEASKFHDKLKRSPKRWKALHYVGIQEVGFGDPDLELRNCTCGSTLAKPV